MRRITHGLAVIALTTASMTPACRCVAGEQRTEQGSGSDDSKEEPGGADDGEKASYWKEGELPPSVTEGEPRKGGRVVVHMYSEPPSLNPIVDSDWWAARLVKHHIQESLVGIDPYDHPEYGYVPELARSWDISDDKKTVTFHLRDDVKWHDGKPFTSRDVIATFDKIQDKSVRAAHVRSYLQELESYEAPDEHTVIFHWKRPYFLALDDPFNSVAIQPAHIIEEMSGTEYNEASSNPLNRSPVGTGPFEFVEWESNQKIVLQRNDDYWGDEAHLDRLVFRIVKELPIALQLAQREELDVVTRVESEAWARMDDPTLRKKYHRSKYYDSNYAWIGWNQQRPYFSDTRVRKALTMLVDRAGVIDKLRYGLPKPTNCHFYWASDACDFGKDPLPHDPKGAVELLEEAGWKDSDDDGIRDKDGTAFSFTFMIPASSAWAAQMGTKLKEDFKRAGIELALQRVEWSSYTRRLRDHEFDACTLLWGSSTPRGDPTQIWHSSSIDGGSNYIGFQNDRVDEILEKARVIFEPEKRNELYREFGEILYEEQPYTFLYVRPRLSLVHERVKGVRESLMYWQYEDWWVEAPE